MWKTCCCGSCTRDICACSRDETFPSVDRTDEGIASTVDTLGNSVFSILSWVEFWTEMWLANVAVNCGWAFLVRILGDSDVSTPMSPMSLDVIDPYTDKKFYIYVSFKNTN